MLILRKPWDSQPQEVAPLDPDWLAKGLVYANTLIHPVDAFSGRAVTFTGTRGSIPRQAGLMRGFGSTLGVGTTDSINTGFTQDATKRSYIVRVFKNAAGGGSLARIFTKFTSGTENELLYSDSTASNRLSFERRFSGGNNQTFWTNLANGESCVLGVTFDASSPTNVAVLWKDGVKQTHTGNVTTTGTVTANTQAMVLGNRVSDNARNWDGLLSDFLIFDAILSDGDMATLTRSPESVFAPHSIWVPVSVGGGSVTGTSATTNANDTSAASGTTTVVGTSATTNAADTSAASGSVGGAVTGTSATTNANDAGAASGTTTVTGTVAYSNANDTSAASGWAGLISGTAAVTNSNDVSSASGSAGAAQAFFGGGYPMPRRRTKKELDDERRKLGILLPEVVEEVAAAPVARRRITLQDLIGKKAAAEITNVDLSQAIAASKKRKRQRDDELLLLM